MQIRKSKKERIKFVVFCIYITITLVLLLMFLKVKYNVYIPCIFHEITGFYCPGCGVTRMFESLFQLKFYQAFRYNSLVFIYTPFIIIYLTNYIIYYVMDKKNYWFLKIPKKVLISILIITILFGILRNIEYFKYLIPTKI